jgi:hypothetical protein
VTVGDREWLDLMRSHGVPEQSAAFLLGIFQASRSDEFNFFDPTLPRLLGHAPISFRQVLATTISA